MASVFNRIGDRFKKLRHINNSSDYARTASTQALPKREDFGGSRVTVPTFLANGGGFSWLPKRAKQDLGLDERTFNTYTIENLMDILSDAHPDVSFAVWNFLRIGNSGYSISVRDVNTGEVLTDEVDMINSFIESLKQNTTGKFEKSKSLSKVINQLMLSVITRGAVAAEVILTPGKKDVAFIAPIDPATIKFRFENNRYVPYQNDTISLDIPTFFYEGLDERIDDPYGRSPLISALNMVMFQLQVLNDIKAVVHNQGYPRFDIKVLEQVLINRMPVTIRNNEEKKQEWLDKYLDQIINMYNSLEPDDSFVHYDSVDISMVGGGKAGGSALIDPQKLMSVIDNLVMSGLKTLSTILGRRSTGQTESYAKLEVKLYLKGVEAIQDIVEDVLDRIFELYLNLHGKQGIVDFKFNPVEIRTDLEKAQFEQIAFMNYAYLRDQGWIDQNEASMMAVGHSAVGDPLLVGNQLRNSDGSVISGTVDEMNNDANPQNP